MTNKKQLTIMVSAGEASGDAHAAHALEALEHLGVNFNSFGMGAGNLKNAGTELILDCRDLAVIGFIDVLLNYHKFLKRLSILRTALKQRKPDLLLLVDYPDFNLKLAETAKALNIPVLFYVSPQVWAWRSGRIPRIGSLVSHMAVLFPFEEKIYQDANIPVTYVGNPVVADAVSSFSNNEAKAHLSLDSNNPVVALLPGSRLGEIHRHLQIMVETAEQLLKQNDSCQFILPIAPTLDRQLIENEINKNPRVAVMLTSTDSRDVMRAADVALIASGTATLEAALIGTPMVVMYRVSPINYAIMKRLIKIPDISLVNIVAGKRIVPEYLQHEAEPAIMAASLASLLKDPAARQSMLDSLQDVKLKMGDAKASERVARLIVELGGRAPPRAKQ